LLEIGDRAEIETMSWNGVFMAEIQNHECLYNKFSREYRNKELRNECWRAVAEKFDMTPMAAEKKFRNIRTAYGRWLRKRRTNPPRTGQDFIPFAFENCEWLGMHIIHRESTLNETTCTKADSGSDDDDDDDDGSPVTMSNIEFLNYGDYNDNISPSRYSNNKDNPQSKTSQNVETEQPQEHIEEETRHLNQAATIELTKQGQRQACNGDNSKQSISHHHNKSNTTQRIGCSEPSLSQSLISMRDFPNEQMANNTRPPHNLKRKCSELEDEDDLYCRSLVPRLKRLTPQGKAYVRIQLEQLLYHAEYSGMIPSIGPPFGSHVTENTQTTTSHSNGCSDQQALTQD
jgi:hypothetical protein